MSNVGRARERSETDGFIKILVDADSKETLTMLGIVLALKAGGSPSTGPLLTLPVTGQ